jgi:hypothetical protein
MRYGMNLRRGFFRLWWAFSVPWMCFWSWHDNLPCLLGFDLTGRSPWCITGLYLPVRPRIETAELILGVPLAVAAAMALVVWVVAGFKAAN